MSSIDPSVYIAEGARIIDQVTLEKDCSVWYNAVIRGDSVPIIIEEGTNIQDNVVVHGDVGFEVHLGKHVTVGHSAIIHGCTIGENSLIGMGAIVLNGARIGRNCLIGAGALVTENAVIPDNSVAVGSPAKVRRDIKPEEVDNLRRNALHYIQLAKQAKESTE